MIDVLKPAASLSSKASTLKLTSILPKNLDSVFFTKSGSEALDTALKIALAYFNAKGMGIKKKLIGSGKRLMKEII